ncbi:dnajc7, partial [Symbiodinium pilosum]
EQDHYSILGLQAKASQTEVKKAYRSLCKRYHPDKAHHLDESTKREREAQMVKLNVAYQVLNSPKQRLEYDLAQPFPDDFRPAPESGGDIPFTAGHRSTTPNQTRSSMGSANPGTRFRYPYSAKYTQRSRQARRMDPSQYTTHVDGLAAEFMGRSPTAQREEGRFSPVNDPDFDMPMPWEKREMDLAREWMQAFCPEEPPEEQYQWTRASDQFLRNLKEKRQQRSRGDSGKEEPPWQPAPLHA